MRRALVAILAACLLGGSAPAALAQDTGEALQDGLSQTPQTTDPQPAPARPRARARELPNTGTDPRVLALTGFSLLLTGAGMRLRTIPEW